MTQATARVGVLGAGSWGTALAQVSCAHAQTALWARNAAVAEEINTRHSNARYLPGVALPEALHASAALPAVIEALHGGDPASERLLILAVPVAGLEPLCRQLAPLLADPGPEIHVLWVCKGIHAQDRRWPHEIVRGLLPAGPAQRSGMLSGPSFALEVARGLPVALCVASEHPRTQAVAQHVLHGGVVRLYSSPDLTGVEVAAALKNVLAIACGIGDGLGLGDNARAALITRGLAEIRRLGVALGAQAETFMGLAGLGDVVLTATGELSRNRQLGLAIGRGQDAATVLARGVTAEGARCARAARDLAREHGVELPITDVVCQVLAGELGPRAAVDALLAREARAESS